MFDDVTSVALQTALRGLSERQRVIADNVANINTPGFLAGRVSFEDELRQAVANGASGASADVAPTIQRQLEPTRTDGNNVNLDEETLANVETGLRYQLALRAMDHEFSLLSIAMRNA